jgi:quercetin dioxygenase-like cupin family protein
MQTFRNRASQLRPADTNTFVGPAHVKLLASSDEKIPVHVYRVEFETGARTNWHSHSGPQWLLIIEGRVRVQHWGGVAEDLETGDAVVFAPNEKHWHGAVPGTRGVHIAVNVNVETTWLEPVSEESYRGKEGIG